MQAVTFPTHNPVLLSDISKPAVRNIPIQAKGTLYLPKDHGGRRPAVILLQGLGGVLQAREGTYGPWLAERGYAVLVVDSFATRNAAKREHTLRAISITEAMILADAFAGLRYLSDHPAIDPDRIHVAGFSYGGMVTILAAYEQIRRAYASDGHRFAGHISYYGASVPRLDDPTATGAPVLMMLGGLDRNVMVERSHQIADDLRRGGAPVEIVVFENAYHQWDADDVQRKFVLLSLHNCRMRVDRDNHVRDEGLGLRYRSRLSRALLLARQTNMSGYHILRCDETLRRSNEMLLAFLGDSGAVAVPAFDGLVAEPAA